MLTAPALLTPAHALNRFSSGVPVLDEWLKRRAGANQVSGASRTFVVRDGDAVAAYHALASSAVRVEKAGGRFRRNMPDPIPVVVLARLAVATSHHGKGLGRALFQDAARRVLNAADAVGIRGMIVHAISEDAAGFYRNLGLEPSPGDPMMLMVTLNDLRAAVT